MIYQSVNKIYKSGDNITVNSDGTIDATYDVATTSAAGLMSATDKSQLNSLPGSITAGTTDLTAGISTLATGTIYLVYE